MPWQAYVIDVAHEVDPVTGWWMYDDIVITVPRQAGKTTLKIPVYVHRLKHLELAQLWMTAQSGGKALDRWNAARAWMERKSSPIRNEIKSWTSVTHEKIEWVDTKSILRPFTPNDTTMHGETPDLVDVDEWWAFDAVAAEELLASYRPGFLTKNAQAWKTSTRGKTWSAGLNADVAAGRLAVEMDRRQGMAYFEWSLPGKIGGVPIAELPDDQLIAAALAIHPAIGFHPTAPAEKMRAHIAADLIENKLGSRAEWIRAYGNRTSDEDSGWSVIPEPSWVASMSQQAIPHGVPVGLAFHVDERGQGSVAATWRDAGSGVAVGEVIKTGKGDRWIPDVVEALTRRWDVQQVAVVGASPARDIADHVDTTERRAAVAEGRVPRLLLRLSMLDYGAACARVFTQTTCSPSLARHIGQAELNDAVRETGRRRVGAEGSWVWADVASPLPAWTVALWAADHPRETEPDIGPFWIR
jgi:hypothetical protein